jgi:hypothetical protein
MPNPPSFIADLVSMSASRQIIGDAVDRMGGLDGL